MSDTDPSVTPIEHEMLRYHVASDDSTKPPYLVDLGCYNGNGGCGCPNFTCRIEPKLVAGERDFVDWTLECKHLKRARAAFALAMTRELDKNL